METREIKVKAWHKDGKYWMNMDELFNSFEYQNPFKRDDLEMVQYTGLKDKNGKEIYEGDIIKAGTDLIGVVKYDEILAYYFIYFEKNDGEISIYSIRDENGFNINREIIGNIYENLELL